MNHINAFITGFVLDLRSRMEREDGLSAMEYFVMMVGLVIAVFFAFTFAGQQIRNGVEDFFNTVFPS